ncbi:uncharacterized protein [Rhodnius prolixus]|uniref:uncharacterized protein n=1 Tax=Rhodnius prolixus TaxID=13249 RepID=UPI003D18F482
MASPFLVFLLGISLQVVTCMSREIFYKIVPVDESEIAEALNELEPDYNWRNNEKKTAMKTYSPKHEVTATAKKVADEQSDAEEEEFLISLYNFIKSTLENREIDKNRIRRSPKFLKKKLLPLKLLKVPLVAGVALKKIL